MCGVLCACFQLVKTCAPQKNAKRLSLKSRKSELPTTNSESELVDSEQPW